MKRNTFLHKIKNSLEHIDPNIEIILFGSRARGDFGKESDWDILIVTSLHLEKEEKRLIRDVIFDIEIEIEEPISTIIYTKEEWETYEITSLYQNIKTEGVRL